MKRVLSLFFLFLSVCAASAEVKRSSRNLQPLTRRDEGATAGTRSGNTGMSVAARKEEAPAAAETRVTFSGPKSGWGFVKVTSPYYTPQGKRLGTLPGGTLFKYDGVKSTSTMALFVCTIKRGESWEGPCLIDCTDITGYEGSPDTLDPATLKSLADYFTLSGKVAERKDALADEALSANPHYTSAKQAMQAYQDSVEKAAEMEKQMSALTGTRKVKADEALRALKYEQVRIKARADQEAAVYKAWKNAHPIDPAKLAADPQLQSLEADLKAAAAKVAPLLPKAP